MIYQTYPWGGGYTKSESDDKFVDKTSNQTIDGVKTFSKNITVKDNANTTGKDLLYLIDDTIKQSNEDENGFPLTGHTNSLKIRGHDNNMISCMLTGQVFTNGDTSAELRAYKYKDIVSDNCRSILSIRYRFADNKGLFTITNIDYLQSSHTNTTNLGSPALQWNNTYTRNILIDNDINIASSIINKTSTSGSLAIRCGTNYTDGASIGMYGKDYNSGMAGAVTINAYGNSDYTNLYIYPNGTISVYNNSTNTTKNLAMQEDVNTLLSGKANSSHTHTKSEITDFPTIPSKTSDLTNDSGFLTSHQDLSGYVPRSGGAVMTDTTIGRADNNSYLNLCGGLNWNNGATVTVSGKSSATNTGMILLHPNNGTQEKTMWLRPDGTWAWDGQACQITSDKRLKQQITQIDNALLDAWEDVELSQFKYNDAVNEKGNAARLHTGYVVQQIDDACKSHNIDISEYGLYCHEEYPQETEEVEVKQDDGTKTKEKKVIREASEHYSLRYTEALVVECAYLRRENNRLKERLSKIEKLLNI